MMRTLKSELPHGFNPRYLYPPGFVAPVACFCKPGDRGVKHLVPLWLAPRKLTDLAGGYGLARRFTGNLLGTLLTGGIKRFGFNRSYFIWRH